MITPGPEDAEAITSDQDTSYSDLFYISQFFHLNAPSSFVLFCASPPLYLNFTFPPNLLVIFPTDQSLGAGVATPPEAATQTHSPSLPSEAPTITRLTPAFRTDLLHPPRSPQWLETCKLPHIIIIQYFFVYSLQNEIF